MPESVRWLASKGRTEEALRVLHKASAMNGQPTAPADPQPKVDAKKADGTVEVGTAARHSHEGYNRQNRCTPCTLS